jgi:sugar phosphate isomerase/epimerase
MPTRRDFIGITGAALASPLASFATPTTVATQPGFELIVLATSWGFSGSWEQFCAKAKESGYDGIEVWYPLDAADREKLLRAVEDHHLRIGFLAGNGERDFQEHLKQFKQMVEGAAALKPLYINCHAGRDHFAFDQNRQFIEFTAEVSPRTGVPIYHETHRSRILYSAPVTRLFAEKYPDLRLTFDVSHWCNVHESLLDDQPETLMLAINRTDHIHARIGHAEGPQVNDPRAPEWKAAADAHFAWWDRIVEIKKRDGKRMTVLTEFGPADYMPTVPYTRQPLANQWEINAFMLATLRKRYA